jgi:L-lysine exporter family protein LysE/ArgO
MNYLFQGLLLGLAYVAPIGMQNLFVINIAIRSNFNKALQVAWITVFFDILLGLSCFFGIGLLIEHNAWLHAGFLLVGAVVVILIGIRLMLAATETALNSDVSSQPVSFSALVAACFTSTWLNPQAIIDGSLLLGGFRASLPPDMAGYFISGVCLASFAWFTSLAMVTHLFHTRMNNQIILWINRICGAVIIFYGLKLGYSFIQFLLTTIP